MTADYSCVRNLAEVIAGLPLRIFDIRMAVVSSSGGALVRLL